MIGEERDRCERVMASAVRSVWCTFQRDGYYDDPSVGAAHHNFHFRVDLVIDSNSTILEARTLRKQLNAWFEKGDLSVKGVALRDVADRMFLCLCERYGVHETSIEIAAEGENGIFVRYPLAHSYQSISI